MQEISWHVELLLNSGKLEEFEKLSAEMAKCARNEKGTLYFERYISDDNNLIHVYERYADSQSAIDHLIFFKDNFSEKFSKLVVRQKFVVYGTPNEELREILNYFGAESYMQPIIMIANRDDLKNR